ncbi:diacylglycerol O-acyltransferase 3 [Apium graveolens]|uniref:diacylglycerol O-acyltransferase 3 n=1 Tax=Apium graveolens TaxID=4045 RepID=UPI003D7A016D
MEVSGVIFQSMPCLNRSFITKSCFFAGDAGIAFSGETGKMGHQDLRVSVKPRKGFEFGDDGHVEYYNKSLKMIRCGGVKEKEKELESKEKKMKKKLKLLKGLSKNISVFSGMGFGLDSDVGLAGEVKGQMISEAADMLLAQLQQLKAEKKEIKRQRKEEKSKLKALRMKNKMECKGDSSSSSESSDDECGEVIDMNRLKIESGTMNDQKQVNLESALTVLSTPNVAEEMNIGVCSSQMTSTSGVSTADNLYSFQENSVATESVSRKIEVCMGGKCKKLGAATLMDEFQKAVGVEGSVVGCKCMGKCKSAPNVKVLNSIDGIQGEVEEDSARKPANPLCIGVGLEDVGTIVSNFLGANQNEFGLAAAS